MICFYNENVTKYGGTCAKTALKINFKITIV